MIWQKWEKNNSWHYFGAEKINNDKDDDNDGTPDTSDDFPLDASEQTDSDSDGIGDNTDKFPSDPTEWSDADDDGKDTDDEAKDMTPLTQKSSKIKS